MKNPILLTEKIQLSVTELLLSQIDDEARNCLEKRQDFIRKAITQRLQREKYARDIGDIPVIKRHKKMSDIF